MSSFGIIVLNRKQEPSYYRKIGQNAGKYGMTVHRFIPSSIDPHTEKITGETFDREVDHWVPATFPIPDILYDRCFYTSRETWKENAPIVEWLKNRTNFLGFGLPNKSNVYEALRSDAYLKHYTIDTVKADHPKRITEELNDRKTVLLKPESGSQGKGILLLKKHKNHTVVQTERRGTVVQKIFRDDSALEKWLDVQLLRTAFLLQPFLSLQNRKKQPFDIRILVHKNAEGMWVEHGRGIRYGQPGGIVSNLHNTGQITRFDEWLSRYPAKSRSVIVDELDGIITRIPLLLERTFGPLFELGLDIGIDTDGAVWILEANSKPGHRTVTETDPDNERRNAHAPLQYARYLLGQKELNSHAATASYEKNG